MMSGFGRSVLAAARAHPVLAAAVLAGTAAIAGMTSEINEAQAVAARSEAERYAEASECLPTHRPDPRASVAKATKATHEPRSTGLSRG